MRFAGGAGAARGSRRARPWRSMAAAGVARPPRDAAPGPGAPLPADRAAHRCLRAVLSLNEYERRRRDLEQRVQALARQEELLRNNAERQQQLAGIAASLETFRAGA